MKESILDITDRLAVLEVVNKYSLVVDDRRWDELTDVFTEDGMFDASRSGYQVVRGTAALRRHMETADHPNAHHVTNSVITEIGSDSVRVHSKVVTVRRGGAATTGDYYDVVVRTAAGWRLREKVAVPRGRDDKA